MTVVVGVVVVVVAAALGAVKLTPNLHSKVPHRLSVSACWSARFNSEAPACFRTVRASR